MNKKHKSKKLKPFKTKKDKAKELEFNLAICRSKINALEKELVSALEEHGRALVQRNHAEEMTQHFYEALRKALRLVRA